MARSFFCGLETGDLSEISSVGAGFSVDSTVKRTGAYSLKKDASSLGGDCYYNLGAGALTRVRFRCYICFSAVSGFGAGNYLSIVPTDIFNTSIAHNAQIVWNIGDSFSRIDILNAAFATVASSSSAPSPSAGQWYRVECDVDITSGNASVYVDGVSVVSTTGQSLGSGSGQYIKIGPQTGAAPGAGFDYYLDDITVDDAALPGAGQIIARQPLTGGTPTYDAWSKSSGSDAGALWDNTPFDTTDYARSATLDAAQTAVISSFSSTQTGHGTETLQSYDTINGLKASLVAKTAATTGTGITQVGNILATSSLNGVDVTLTFSTAPQTGDVVYVWGGHTSTRATPIGPSTSGYDVVGSIQTQTTNTFGVWRKVMGYTPDTAVVCQGTGNTADSTGYGCIVLRQVNTSTPEDATIVWANGSSTNPDPGSITPTTTGAAVIICAGSVNNDSAWTSPANYGTTVASGSNDTNPYSIGGAVRTSGLTGGTPENPANWTSVVTGVWITATIAVKPASEAGSAMKHRRRFGGSDTDTALTLTTSDAYYESSVFTDTLTNLNAAEIGAVHGSTSLLQTVEDVWIMAEYTPGTPPAFGFGFYQDQMPGLFRKADMQGF